jgi:hypothetical protein
MYEINKYGSDEPYKVTALVVDEDRDFVIFQSDRDLCKKDSSILTAKSGMEYIAVVRFNMFLLFLIPKIYTYNI